ncbi:hypothetical protein CI109_106767 [Kwoniella shandongensis]|uniref:Uncharacterized protein n=1 Tax=Kwoniella shandongensis TaxID=1734106 RepID=A0A5M6C6P2_9TREE|nr:uncharacterized protein CI109_000977 [Kwoniella shandongensis]KAA5530797.1 hypothetical protein CI109_000977 [Kwoniella shandongensis]
MSSSQMRSKRPRSISSASSASSSSIGSSSSTDESRSPPQPPPKYHRAPSPTLKPYTCNIAPTCSQPGTSTSYSTEPELERHQETFHKWICRVPIRDKDSERGTSTPEKGKGRAEEDGWSVPEGFVSTRGQKRWKECMKVFPEERLLELHHTETHDPIARERKESGAKIFECFLPSDQCGKKFLDPRRRRRHLIDKHKYPRQYFFAITNHGLNDIVRQDGLAISLIRPRKDHPVQAPLPQPLANDGQQIQETAQEEDNGTVSPKKKSPTPDVDMDYLTTQMGKMESSLTFVPRGVRKAAKAKENGKVGSMALDTVGND